MDIQRIMDIITSIIDFFPVGFFLAASILVQRDLYNKMSKGAFALFASGTIIVFVAGFTKALHKIIFFTTGLNFYSLCALFFPMQTVGFVLAAVGLVAMCFYKQGEHKAYSFVLPALLPLLTTFKDKPDDSGKLTMVFVVLMCLGVFTMYGLLGFFSVKAKMWIPLVLLVVAFIGTLGMGYLSTKDELNDIIKESVNAIGQGSFLAAAIILHKKGLGKEDSLNGLLKAE